MDSKKILTNYRPTFNTILSFDSGGAGGLRKSKKYVQTFIPLFLAFNAVGWMLLAVKAVAVLTVKALVVSKLALLVAGTFVFKKLMDSATEK